VHDQQSAVSALSPASPTSRRASPPTRDTTLAADRKFKRGFGVMSELGREDRYQQVPRRREVVNRNKIVAGVPPGVFASDYAYAPDEVLGRAKTTKRRVRARSPPASRRCSGAWLLHVCRAAPPAWPPEADADLAALS